MNYRDEIRKAIGFARERGWKIIKKSGLVHGALVRGEPKIKVCPLMAVVIMHAKEPARKAQLKKHEISSDSLARRVGKILGVPDFVAHEFMGSFDGNEIDDRPWPRGASPKHIRLAMEYASFGEELRKELKPKHT